MAGSKNSQPTQISNILERSARFPGNRVVGDSFRLERRRLRVSHRFSGDDTAKPVTDPISVAGPDEDCNSGLDDGGECGEE